MTTPHLLAYGTRLAAFFGLIALLWACGREEAAPLPTPRAPSAQPAPLPELPLARLPVTRAVPIREYFGYLDSLVAAWDSLVPYPLDEHLLARANPWLVDSLVQTDYYLRMARGDTLDNQPAWTILRPGDTLLIPGPQLAQRIRDTLAHTVLDINIPAFTLRIVVYDSTRYSFPVRVGRNERKYLAMAGRTVDLRTRSGSGQIVRIERNPAFINPSDGKRYQSTRRDDGRRTQMPQIPWLEPEINGQRFGQLIHPTTNPNTLGKAYSNGCIGTGEGAAWRIYYAAPLGTQVVLRYDLEVEDAQGNPITLPDIYGWKRRNLAAMLAWIKPAPPCCAVEGPNHVCVVGGGDE